MKPEMRVTVLVENTVYRAGLRAEHGLSLWIEYEDHRLLFDTGQSDILVHNAQTVGIDLACADAVVLSHGHYDHTGGVGAVLDRSSQVRVYCHSHSLEPKYHVREGTPRSIGIPCGVKERLLLVECQERLVYTDQVADIFPGATVTGTIPKKHACQQPPQAFYLDRECQSPDPMKDDQALFLDTSRGIVVLLGCAHAGALNTLEYIQRIVDDRCIYAVIGGMHLQGADSDSVLEIRTWLQSQDVRVIAPGHCTGPNAIAEFNQSLPEQWMPCSTGTTIEI